MEKVTKSDIGTLSLLGIRIFGKWTEPESMDECPEFVVSRSQIVYHLEFEGEDWSYYRDDERSEGVVKAVCERFKLTSEEVGENSFVLRETITCRVRDPQSLLRARMRNVQGISRMLVKNNQLRDEIHETRSDCPTPCENYREGYAEIVAFGESQIIIDHTHPRTCQACRFWKAEHDRRVAKVDSRPGSHIDEVA